MTIAGTNGVEKQLATYVLSDPDVVSERLTEVCSHNGISPDVKMTVALSAVFALAELNQTLREKTAASPTTAENAFAIGYRVACQLVNMLATEAQVAQAWAKYKEAVLGPADTTKTDIPPSSTE